MKKEHTLFKRCLSILLSITMIVGLIVVTEPEKASEVQAAESTNLITNGGFETGALASGFKNSKTDTTDGLSIVTAPVHDGSYAAKIDTGATMKFTTDGANGGALMDANKQYKLSAYVYTETDSTIQLYVPTWDAGWGNAQMEGDNLFKTINVAANTWTLLEYYVPIKTYQSLSQPRFENTTGGVMYIDNIVLEEWDGSITLSNATVDANTGFLSIHFSAIPDGFHATSPLYYNIPIIVDGVSQTAHMEVSGNTLVTWDTGWYNGSNGAATNSIIILKDAIMQQCDPNTGWGVVDGGCTLRIAKNYCSRKQVDGTWLDVEYNNELTLSFSKIDGGNNWMFNRSEVMQTFLDGTYYQFDAYVDNVLKTLWLEFSGNETYIYAGVIGTPAESLRIPAGTVLYEFDAANTGAKVEGGRQMILASTLYVEKSEDTWQEVIWVPKVTFGFEKNDGGNWWITREVATDFDNTWYQAQVMVDGNEQTAWIEFISGYAYIYGHCFGGNAPTTSLLLKEETVLYESAPLGDKVANGKELTLSDTFFVTCTDDVWSVTEYNDELTLSFSTIDGGNNWMFNRSSVSQYFLDGKYYQFEAYVDGVKKTIWLEFSGNETYIYAGVIGTPAESLRIPAGTVLYEFDAANTGAKVEGGRQMILASTLYVEKSEDTWQEVTWVPKVTFGFEKIDGGHWWITREVATDFDNTWYQAQVMVDGNEQTAWIEFISGYAYIYSHCFGGNAPTTSLLLKEGTVLYESVALGEKVPNGKELTLSEHFYVVCTDGTWVESVFSSVTDNTPDATNMPSDKESMISGGDFTTDQSAIFAVKNAEFTNGYVKISKPSGEERAFLRTPALNFVKDHSYTISYYVNITEATGLTLDMLYESSSGTSGFDSSEAWGKNFMLAQYTGGTDVSYRYNDVTTIPASITTTTDDWAKIEFTWTAEQNDTAYIYLMAFYGQATIYVDDLVVYDNTVKQTVEITPSKAYPVSDNSWYIEIDDITKATAPYYRMTMQVDGKEATVPVGISDGKLVIWCDLINVFDGTEIPSESFVIPKDTILYPIDPINVDWNTEIDANRLKVTQAVEVYAFGSGWYSKEHDTSATPIYYCIDNNMSYMVTSSAGAYEITKDGVKVTATKLTEVGTYDITRIEQDTKFVQKVVLYKSGDAHTDTANNITSQDLVAVKKAALAENTNTLGEQFAADVNQSKNVDAFDAKVMRRALVSDDAVGYLSKVKGNTSLNGEMPIIGFDGPDTKFLNGKNADTIYSMIKELGFNTVLLNRDEVGTNYAWSSTQLSIAEKYGLKLYLNDGYINDETNVDGIGSVIGDTAISKLSNITSKYEGYSSFGGYYIEDEPMYNAVYNNKKQIDAFDVPLTTLKNYTNIHSYMNLAPYIAGNINEQLGGSSSSAMSYDRYKTYVNASSTAGVEALSYDMYLRGNGSLPDWISDMPDGAMKDWLVEEYTAYKIHTEDFWTNLDWMSKIAKADSSKNPFYAFVQVGNDFSDKNETATEVTNLTTIQEMYFEANAALAMGAKGINYYSLVQPEGYVTSKDNSTDYTRSGLINYLGEKNNGGTHGNNYQYYNAAKKINAYIKAVDEVLMNATNEAVITTNSTVAGYLENEVSSYGSIASINNTEVLVGCFDYYGQEAFMVVNITPDAGNSGSAQNVTLTFDGAQSGQYIDMDDAAWQEMTSSSTLALTIPAGEAVVIVLD